MDRSSLITNGAVLQLFPTIEGAKVAGLLSFYIALAIMFITFVAKARHDPGDSPFSLC